MSGYTVKNLRRDVEDAAARAGMQGNEARFARRALGLEQSGLTYMRVEPGLRTPFGHRHERQEEVYLVLSGGGRIKLDDDVVEVGPLDAVRIARETMRCVEAGPDGIELVLFGAPAVEPGDAQLEPGWWVD